MQRVSMLAATLVLGSCAQETPAPTIPAHPGTSELLMMMEAGDATSVDIVTELLSRTNESGSLNAFITINAQAALARAEELDQLRRQGTIVGPLHGIPLVVKDNIHVAGLPNTAGTPALADFMPGIDSPVVAALRDAGAIILGKTNMHELAFGITSDNAAFGAVANPYDTSMFPGGSSGGTASAISAGLAPAGLGTDTGGSLRIPASLTGTVGFRPSTGRYTSSGVTPISHTRDTVGVIARSVADVILLDGVIEPQGGSEAPIVPGEIRLGVPRAYYYANMDRQSAIVIEAALTELANAGITLIEVDPEGIAVLLTNSAFPIALYEVARDLPDYLDEFEVGVSLSEVAAYAASPDVQGIFAALTGDGQVSHDVYAAALSARAALRVVFREYFATNELDAMIFPTTLLPARPIEGSLQTVELNGEEVPTFPTYIHNTDPASIAALPGISLPVGLTVDGLPVGIEIDGPEDSDQNLLAIAAVLEQVFGYSARPPNPD